MITNTIQINNTSNNQQLNNLSKSNELSLQNKKILTDYAKKMWGKLSAPVIEPETKTLSGWLWSWVPGSKSAGSFLGGKLANLHGPVVTGMLIEAIIERLTPEIPSKSYWFKAQFYSSTKAVLSEGIKGYIIPIATPLLVAAGGVAGGLALETAIGVVASLYHQIMQNPEKIKELQLQKLTPDALLENPSEFEGLLDKEDLKQITQLAIKYDLAFKLSQAKTDEVEKLLNEYIITRSDGKKVFKNGAKISSTLRDALKQSVELLTTKNITNNAKPIKQLLDAIAYNAIVENQDAKDSSKNLIKCYDGKMCTSEGEIIVDRKKGFARPLPVKVPVPAPQLKKVQEKPALLKLDNGISGDFDNWDGKPLSV